MVDNYTAEKQAKDILELYRAYRELKNGAEVVEVKGREIHIVDEICTIPMNRIQIMEVRTDWHSVRTNKCTGEYRILLNEEFPKVQLNGALDKKGNLVEKVYMRLQKSFFSGWYNYTPVIVTEPDWEKAINWFVECVYDGENLRGVDLFL